MSLALVLGACRERKEPAVTPWGTIVDGGQNEEDASKHTAFSLSDIQAAGELIMLTMSGPETYYDYHGHGMGTQYLLCEKFAQQIGVSLRVEVCKDTSEMVRRLERGDADVIVYQLPRRMAGIRPCGFGIDSLKTSWAVRSGNRELADTLDRWYSPALLAKVRDEESFKLSARSVVRRVYSPMLDRGGGVISHYDALFRRYAPVARWDWRLLAAQCYQESTFDPRARSWAGACGLMQIIPSTAAHLGLPMSQIYDPEQNIAAAARYIRELDGHFKDVANPLERCCFVLASYNGGYFHIRDAMALARKHGRNPYAWSQVAEFVLKLREPQYYQDPVVKHGYMRGNETYDYVSLIRARWAQYRGVALPGAAGGFGSSGSTPQKAKKAHRFKL